MILYLIILLLIISTSFFGAMYWTVKIELRHLQDTLQLKILSKHIALTREIEALTKFRDQKSQLQLNFEELDKIINNLSDLR